MSQPGGLYLTFRYPEALTPLPPARQVLHAVYSWILVLEDRFDGSEVLTVKWPNDLMFDGRKLAGVLTEVSQGMVHLGVGLNVNNDPDARRDQLDRHATSLYNELGRTLSRRVLLFEWLRVFEASLREDSKSFSLKQLEQRLSTIGEWVRCKNREGRAVSLRPDGALSVEKDGREFPAYSGDVLEVSR